MRLRSRQRAIAFFIAFGACLVALAVALNVGWIILNWRQVAQLVFGVIFFMAIIVGIVLNTIFLVREIHRNEQHDDGSENRPEYDPDCLDVALFRGLSATRRPS